ncbi:MFS transporter [Microcella sp.]|uniref:MFS transporter n=1 Tax=Microcella sp. TaxID=1913979 RepID=UPI00299F7966|nr:MFS transporter [Microcella sp.]MDX2026963.1 MFS transporter [Microcella sp.]
MTTSTSTRPSLSAWRIAVFAVFAINGLAMATWFARTPAVRDALDVRTDEFGFLIMGMAGGSIVGLMASSHIIARIGSRTTILVALLSSLGALAVMGLGAEALQSFAVTFIALAVFGAANGITDVAQNVEGAGVEQAQGRSIMPWFHAAWSLGTITGAGIAAALSALNVGVAAHSIGMAIVLGVATLIVVRYLPKNRALPGLDDDGEGPARSTFGERMGIWREPRTLLIGLVVLGMAFAEGSANDWLALAIVDDRGADEATGALSFTLFAVAMTVGRIGGVWVLDRFGRVPVLRGSAVLAIAGLALLITVDSPVAAAIGIVAWGLGASLGFPVGMSAAADDPAKAAARVSAVATVGYFAFLVGPPLIGILGEAVGLLTSFWVVLVLIAVAFFATPAARETGAAATSAATRADRRASTTSTDAES